MARRHHRRGSRSRGGLMSSVHKALTPLGFAYAFVPQITGKDTATSSTYNSLSAVEKLKFLANSVSGRTTGFNPFSQYGNQKVALNPSGVVNKYTGMGLGLMIYSAVAPKGFGGKGIARKAGKGIFWGGVIGGLFDDPVELPSPNTSYNRALVPSNTNPLAPN